MRKKFSTLTALIMCIAVCAMTSACAYRAGDFLDKSIYLDRTELSLKVGESAVLTATVTPNGEPVLWTSASPGIATVKNGVVKAVSAGTTLITAALQTEEKATCYVTVKEKPSGGGGGVVEPEQTDITFWHWGSTYETSVFNRLVEKYEEENPNINIITTHYDAAYYMTNLSALTVKPDVFFLPDIDFAQWASDGLLLPLDDYVTQSEINSVWDSSITDYRYDGLTKTLGKGALYGFPKDLGPVCLAYNVDLLDYQMESNSVAYKHGMTKEEFYAEYLDPKKPMTWEQFTELLVDLTDDQDKANPDRIYGIPYFELESALYSNNADFISEDGSTQKIDERFIETVIFNILLDTKYHVMPDAYHSGIESSYSRFYRGNTIFTWMGPWDNAEFWQHPDLNYNVIPVPYNGAHDDTKSVTYVGSMCYAVSANSTKKQAAADFAKWLGLSESSQSTAMKLGQQIPNIKSMASAYCNIDNRPANKSLFIDMVDDENTVGIYKTGEKDIITSKRRTAYRTYDNAWKDNLLNYMIYNGLWLTADESYIRSALINYASELQRDLDRSESLWGRR